jgi:hypothetical protein
MFRARKVPFLMPGQRPNRSPELWIISEPFGDDQITRARYGDESEKESSSLSLGFFVCSPFTRHGIVPQPTTKCHNFWELRELVMRHWNAVAATASFTLARLPTEWQNSQPCEL